MSEDWLYSEQRLALRAKCLSTMLELFGGRLDKDGAPMYSMESIHNCVHDWVSQGHPNHHGIGNYFLRNYTG